MISRRFAKIGAALFGLALALSGCSALGEGSLPYTDSNAHGSIGLCNKDGKSINHGNLNDIPFVWRAVSSSPAPPPYNGNGRTATLFAFLPWQGHSPELWPGNQLTVSDNYSNPAHPMVQATASDGAQLKEFIQAFPPRLNGLIELRMYLGVPGEPTYKDTYPATDIQVKGDSWTVVRGGDVPCSGSVVGSRRLRRVSTSQAAVHHGWQDDPIAALKRA